jgi:tyrosyl-tRNA synthetase
MDAEKRFKLIKRNTEEILTEPELKKLLRKKKHPSGYIGYASTGRIHIGYFIPIIKISDFLKAGFKFIILLADVHAHLDNQKSPWHLLDYRFEYYSEIIKAMFESVGVDHKDVKFVRGSELQLNRKYMMDVLKLSAIQTLNRCKRAAHEVVKFGEDPKLSGFIYPIMQSLDEEYLKVDVQYGGQDQRKILAFAREALPKLGYKPRIEVMTPMLPGLHGEKMSASEEKSKVDLLDPPNVVERKIAKAFCPAGRTENNGVLAFMKYVIMVLKEDNKKEFLVERPEKFGGNVSYKDYKTLEKDFVSGKLHPEDLKKAMAKEVNKMLDPVRKKLRGKTGLVRKAYP